MNIEEFFRRYVEGYLFEDLDTMRRAEPHDGQVYGRCGYSMVLVSMAGIELLGTLVADQHFSYRKGDDRFLAFWRDYLYPGDAKRADVGEAIRRLVRNGLAHMFLPKPGIVVSTEGTATANHLVRGDSGELLVDAHRLAHDLRAAYMSRVRPLLSDPVRVAQMQTRLNEIIESGTVESNDHVLLLSTLSAHDGTPFTLVPSGERTIQVNSPTVPRYVATLPRLADTHGPD